MIGISYNANHLTKMISLNFNPTLNFKVIATARTIA